MTRKLCKKLQRGNLEYEISEEEQYLRLFKDFPRKGAKGARFDSSRVPFEDINRVLRQKPSVKTCDFGTIFSHNLSNNGPMLTAALVHEQVLRQDTPGRFTVLRTL